MAWITGWPDGPPILPGICDPLAGVHAAFAVLAALDQRRRTGEGQQIEMAMLDMAVNIAVEQILEWAAYGHLVSRQGNRGPTAAPQGAYACAQPDTWVAIAVSSDPEWQALCAAMANDDLAGDETLGNADGRRSAHDRIDKELAAWCAQRTLDDALDIASRRGRGRRSPWPPPTTSTRTPSCSPAASGRPSAIPSCGVQRYPGWPMRLSGGPDRWHRSPAPLLGQHNDEILISRTRPQPGGARLAPRRQHHRRPADARIGRQGGVVDG